MPVRFAWCFLAMSPLVACYVLNNRVYPALVVGLILPFQVALSSVMLRDWAGALDHLAKRFAPESSFRKAYDRGDYERHLRAVIVDRRVLVGVVAVCLIIGTLSLSGCLGARGAQSAYTGLFKVNLACYAYYELGQGAGGLYLIYALLSVAVLLRPTRALLVEGRRDFQLRAQPPWLGLDDLRGPLTSLSILPLFTAIQGALYTAALMANMPISGPSLWDCLFSSVARRGYVETIVAKTTLEGTKALQYYLSHPAASLHQVGGMWHHLFNSWVVILVTMALFVYLVSCCNGFLRWGKRELRARYDEAHLDDQAHATIMGSLAEVDETILPVKDSITAHAGLIISTLTMLYSKGDPAGAADLAQQHLPWLLSLFFGGTPGR
jgi:hypothetical protein